MPKDYLLDDDFDLRIKDGDFVVGESTAQNQDLLMMMQKGELRQFPKTGIGMETYLNDDAIGDLFGEIQKQFEADGMRVDNLKVTSDGKVNVNAVYRE